MISEDEGRMYAALSCVTRTARADGVPAKTIVATLLAAVAQEVGDSLGLDDDATDRVALAALATIQQVIAGEADR